MKFPFRDFWSRLIVKFGDFTYYSAVQDSFKDQRLLVEMSMIK